jgi:hypothetical protein
MTSEGARYSCPTAKIIVNLNQKQNRNSGSIKGFDEYGVGRNGKC